ncbi:MAG: DUF5752 family protein [bacterium]
MVSKKNSGAALSGQKPFAVKDCSMVAISAGRHARSLRELSMHLQAVELDSIYQHFWGGRLRPQFDEPEFQNDFASWVRHALHDHVLSEQLGVLDPTDYRHLEDLRAELVDIIEQRLAKNDYLSWAQAEQPFTFVKAQIVVFDTHRRIKDVEELCSVFPYLSLGSVFYHFIEARRREPMGIDDFRAWLARFNSQHQQLMEWLAAVDPYFGSLSDLRHRISEVLQRYLEKSEPPQTQTQ